MLGVDVTAIELREDLPDIVRDDIDSDFDGDDDTPRVDSPRVKTVQMPPIVVDPDPSNPAAPRTTTRPRAAMRPLPHPPPPARDEKVVVAMDDLDEGSPPPLPLPPKESDDDD
jgi:hypothetical protein